MTLKTLQSIVLAGAVALSSCYERLNDDKYVFNGTLGKEKIEFKRIMGWSPIGLTRDDTLYLRVTPENGKTVLYQAKDDYLFNLNQDWSNGLKLERVEINGKSYLNNDVGTEALKVAQQQFEGYLERILTYKQEQAVEAVKNFSSSK